MNRGQGAGDIASDHSGTGQLEETSMDPDVDDTEEPVMTLVEWERWALHKLALNQFSREQITAADQHCKRLGELLGAPALAGAGGMASAQAKEKEPGHTTGSSPAS